MSSDRRVLSEGKGHLNESILLPALGHDGSLDLVAAIGAGLGKADGACTDIVIPSDILIADLDGHVILIDDVKLEHLVPDGVLPTIGVGLALVPLAATCEDTVGVLCRK